ncbi:hypothetical protein JOQ06_011074, partial [Pogonophryne albipinna]
RPEYAHIETAARNLLSLLTSTVSQGQVQDQGQPQPQVQNQSQSSSQGTSQELRVRPANVQQEMTKSFPGLFRREQTSGKRDPAIGEGVNRYWFSRVMQKLKEGFNLNFGVKCCVDPRASSDELKELVKFWVGWEAPSSTLTVECCLLLMAQQMACLRNSDPMVWIIRQATVLPVKMRE